MESQQSRGTMRPLPANADNCDIKTQLKRRISFSGKNSVRIFRDEEEPKTWNNSYEISDSNETATNIGPSKTRKLQKCRDFDKCVITENLPMYPIENSLDITLSEIEQKFQIAKFKKNETMYSFSVEDHEKEDRSLVFVEKTIDFMREINQPEEKINDSMILDFEDVNIPIYSECMEKVLNTTKFYPSVTIDQQLESLIQFSSKSKEKIIPMNDQYSRLGINFNQYIQDGMKSSKAIELNTSLVIPRPTIYFNKSFEISPVKFGTDMEILNLSQSNQIDLQTSAHFDCDTDKVKLRPTIYFNQTVEISPQILKNYLIRKNLNFEKLSQEPTSIKNLNYSASIHKYRHQPKSTVGQICSMNLSKSKNIDDGEQLQLDGYRQIQTKNKPHDILKDNAKTVVGIENRTRTDPSLSFSLDTIEGMSSSPTMQIEDKWYRLKQLNDELEWGNVKTFSGAPKTLLTVGKNRNSSSVSRVKNVQQRKSALQNIRTLIFEDESVLVSSEDTLYNKPNHSFHFNTTEEGFGKGSTNNGRCRNSEVADVNLDNTSFLTTAKTSDQTESCNSSTSQIKNFIDISNQSLKETAGNVDGCTLRPNVEMQNLCNVNPSIKTLLFNKEISEGNFSTEIEVNNHNSTYVKTYFDNIIPVEGKPNSLQKENIRMDENILLNLHAEPSNADKIPLLHQLKSKLVNKLENNLIAPKKINHLPCTALWPPLLEFTSLEKNINEEDTETNYKRSSFALTPEFSVIAKRRKSLEFHNCSLDHWEESKCSSTELINKSCVKNDAMEMSVVISNESYFPVSYVNISSNEDAMKMSDSERFSNDSVISVPIDKPFSLVEKSSNNHNYFNDKLESDAEHMAESVQLIRSAGICRRTGTANMPASSQKYNNGEKIEHIQLTERSFVGKHYEETFQDEDSFIIPKLPSIPHLRLSFLEKLLERKTIVDDIVFWERESLECTTAKSFYDTQLISNLDKAKNKNCAITKAIKNYEENILSYKMNLFNLKHKMPSESRLSFVLRLNALLISTNWICDYRMQYRGNFLFTHKKTVTLVISLSFEDIDHFGHNVSLQSIKLVKSTLPKRTWKPIDFFLEFQLKLNLPYNLTSLLKGENEVAVFEMLKKIDLMCLKTLQIGNSVLRICYANQASIVRDGGRTCVHKIVREIVDNPNTDFKCVKKTVINIELLDIKTLSYKDILIPRLHHFKEKIHLLPTGLKFLQEFLPDPLNYLKVF